MFGFFENDKKKIARLRNDFEDIRQRVLFKMNPFEQYSFGTVFDHIPKEIADPLANIGETDLASWKKFGEGLLEYARVAYKQFSKMSGLAGEGGRAGSEGLALLAIETLTKSYNIAEATVLRGDIERFRTTVNEFVTSDDYASRYLPKDL